MTPNTDSTDNGLGAIEHVTVLGAGSMGHGIAEVIALAGYAVTIRDIDQDILESGYENIEWSLEKLVEQNQISQDEADAVLDRIQVTTDLAAATADTDFVIEAVPERMEIKEVVFTELTDVLSSDAVVATNTSSLSITSLSEFTDRQDRFCGIHFFNPPVRLDLVEVIAGEHTTDDTLTLAESFVESLEKTPIRVQKDTPGFVVNRILVPLLNEAAWLVSTDESTVATIDSTTKYQMGLPMGAFELADHVGLDIAVDILHYMHDQLGDAYEPAPVLLEKTTNEEYGRKSNRGFYDYTAEGVQIPADEASDTIEEHLLALMANETAKLIETDVAPPDTIDTGLELGAGFPSGPATLADEHELSSLVDHLDDWYSETNNERYRPSPLLISYAENNRGFYDDADTDTVTEEYETLTVTITDAVGYIELDRPHRMNALTLDVIDELEQAVTSLEESETARVIVITGAGDRAFSVGADTTSFSSGITPTKAAAMSRRGHDVYNSIEQSPLPVIAGIDGYALGGGMELAAACDLRIASERAEFGQPEHDLGLLPGWGGTQRLPRIIGEGRAKEIIFTTDRYDPETMESYGFLSRVIPTDEFDSTLHDFAQSIADGPPIAQEYTKRAIHAGRDSFDTGLDLEAHAFGLLTSTDDLVEGITAFMEDRDPEFTGE